ncbi:hypothetical protein QL285_014537 [Trifolium repens]|nr:hypothetical protein QL285_014537 [Trifolium repens]
MSDPLCSNSRFFDSVSPFHHQRFPFINASSIQFASPNHPSKSSVQPLSSAKLTYRRRHRHNQYYSNGKKKKLNIGSRMLKESNQGSNATHTTSTHAQGSNDEEAHRTSTHAQGSSAEETHRTSNHAQGSSAEETHRTLPHAQGSSVEETHSNPTQMEDDTNDSEDSHYIPSDIEAEEAYIEKVVELKRLRGPTRMQDVWDMDADDIIIVNLDKKGRPTGQEGSSLTRFIGSIVRRKEYASIGYVSLKDMPDNDKSEMLKLIESKYEFVPPINDTTREMLKSEINEKWKQWKSDLKSKAYDPSKTEEEVASVKPDSRVDLNQYRKLVHHWFSEKGQKKNANGRSPTRKEIYVETRTRKDGSIVNEEARGVIEKLNKYDNETGTSQSVEEIQSDMPWKDDIYSKVKGTEKRGEQRGRLRCIGKIPKPKKLKVSLAENQELRDKVKQMEKKQDNTNAVLANVLSLIQNRFAGEDVNDILRAARQVTDASNAPDQTDSPSPYTDED